MRTDCSGSIYPNPRKNPGSGNTKMSSWNDLRRRLVMLQEGEVKLVDFEPQLCSLVRETHRPLRANHRSIIDKTVDLNLYQKVQKIGKIFNRLRSVVGLLLSYTSKQCQVKLNIMCHIHFNQSKTKITRIPNKKETCFTLKWIITFDIIQMTELHFKICSSCSLIKITRRTVESRIQFYSLLQTLFRIFRPVAKKAGKWKKNRRLWISVHWH